MHLKLGQTVGHLGAIAGQKRGADAVGHGSKPQIKAGGLDLVGQDGGAAVERACGDHGAQGLGGQNSGCGHGKCPFQNETARAAGRQAGGFVLVGPERFELSTSRPPDGRANQAALRPDE